MSVLKTFNRILAGPLYVPQNYGDYLWIFSFVALCASPKLNILHLTLGSIALYPILMYYNLATATLVTNAVMENPSAELQSEVNQIAEQEQVHVSFTKTVSNFTVPTMIHGRFASNAELFISTHFLEEKNSSMRRVFLHESFKQLHSATKLMILYTAIAAALVASNLLTIKLAFIYLAGHTIAKWIVIMSAVQLFVTASLFLKAYANRKLTFALDKKLAQQLGTQTVIAALQDLNTQRNFDNNLHDFPEWALAIPKFSSRVAALSDTTC